MCVWSLGTGRTAMSTFITVGSRSSDDMTMRERERECVCVGGGGGINLKYALRWHISTYISSFRAIPVLYTSTRFLQQGTG